MECLCFLESRFGGREALFRSPSLPSGACTAAASNVVPCDITCVVVLTGGACLGEKAEVSPLFDKQASIRMSSDFDIIVTDCYKTFDVLRYVQYNPKWREGKL